MQIFNTLTRQKEEFVPQVPGEYRIYVCGPTVYNYIHIGNARPLIVFDTLRRYLEYRGNKVIYVSNITDIDDKLIKKGQEEGTSMKEVAQRFEAEYLKDAAGLNCKKPTVQPRATEHIQQILDIVKDLIDSGHAYVAKNGDVYFRVKSDPEYGKLSHLKLDDLESGNRELRSRMDDDLKEDPADFAVWKAAKPGEPAWESPYGMGRPGWHIECSAMSRTHLGKTIDLHCGGQDLIFPHHENEIAQSECANGCTFSHYWMHNGYINVDNVKMSKSKGNFFTTRDVAEKYGYEKLHFYQGDIASYTGRDEVDMVVTLHACDTATDYALEKAVKWNAKVILSVPCCQHELNKQIRSEELSALTKYGIIKERTAALMTDAIRGCVLEYCGYKTDLLEFIDIEHSPKNILIRAVKKPVSEEKRERAKEEADRLCRTFGIRQTLMQLVMTEERSHS